MTSQNIHSKYVILRKKHMKHPDFHSDNISGSAAYCKEYRKHIKECHPGVYKETCVKNCKRGKDNYSKSRFGSVRMSSLKNHAKFLGVPMNVTPEDLEFLWVKQKGLCYYTKTPMEFSVGKSNMVSIDRINPNKGYTVDNICLCCDRINCMKAAFSYFDFLNICKSVVENALNVEKNPDLKEGSKVYYYASNSS